MHVHTVNYHRSVPTHSYSGIKDDEGGLYPAQTK